ncbi:metal-dependent hydrolase (plasmid) [Haloferacaceae archaeon DSL9]
MLPTHALAGMLLALPFAVAFPEFGAIALAAGLLGGAVPDFDMYTGHRKTLHYPVYYSLLAVVVVPLAVVAPAAATVGAAGFLLAAAAHSGADAFGGGLELRPWEATSERAVYDHYRGRWLAPRRWVRYDGAPEDLLLSVAFGVPLLHFLDGVLGGLVLSMLLIAVGYTAVRRVLPTVAERVVDRLLVRVLPDSALRYVPDRYVVDAKVRSTADECSADRANAPQ